MRRQVILNPQHVRLAAHLAIFDITLPVSGGLIHRRGIPLATARTLKARLHAPLNLDPIMAGCHFQVLIFMEEL